MLRLRRAPARIQASRDRGLSNRHEHTYDKPYQAAHDLPPVVYYIQGVPWSSILVVQAGTREDESAAHRKFAAHLARGREYFHPHPDLIAHINEIRAQFNTPPVEIPAA